MQRIKARYVIECLAHALFWLVLYYALKGLTVASYTVIDRTVGSGVALLPGHAHSPVLRPDMATRTVQTLFPYAGIVLGFLVLLFYSCAFWLFKKIIRYKSNAVRAAIVAGWITLIYGANYLLVHLLITGSSGLRTAKVVADDPLNPPDVTPLAAHWAQMQLTIALAFLAVLGIAAAYFLIREWIRNELVRSQIESVQLATELRLLRSQVNPHFLFNTLNNLFAVALKEGKSSLAGHIAKLSGMMRYMLYESISDRVPLAKEIECLKDYLALHGMRYAPGEADVSFQYPDSAVSTGVQVAPMLFLPFLENAFKHGVAVAQQSCIALMIEVKQQQLVFRCENTDHSAVTRLAEETGGIGLANVRRRLELLYPGRYALQAGPQNGNYIVNLQIDLLC